MRVVLAALAATVLAAAQAPNPLLNTAEANQLFTRSLQLMDAATVAIPELNRAAAPIIETAKQAATNLRARAGNMQATYTFLSNLRAYALLADSVPRPYPFPAEAAKQQAELRDHLARLESHFRALLDQREGQLRSPDRDNLRRYADANATLSDPRPGKPRVVFLGDSITDGWRLNEYFPDQEYVNRGIGGQITSEMLGRFKADVINLKPEAVVILAGTNDLARGIHVITIENNYSMLMDLADKNKIKVIFASVLPISDYHKDKNPSWEQSKVRPPVLIRALNDWIKSVCEQRGYTYLDYFTDTVDNSGFLKADLADDGLHPNSAGYRVMAPLAMAAIEKTIKPPPTQLKPVKRRLFSKGQE